MKDILFAARLAAFALTVLAFSHSHAQAVPTATRRYDLSAFGGISGVYTGLGNGKNLSISAGIDLGFRPFFGVSPSLEVRGLYPVDSGGLDDERNILGGIKISKPLGRLTPYGDALFGRGEIKYINGYVDPTGTIDYLENPTNVLSGGGGIDLRVTDHFSVKADAQIQRYKTPVTTTGHLYSKPLTLAVVYHFSFGHFPTR